MTKFFIILFLSIIWTGGTHAHQDGSHYPDLIQIMQYRVALMINPDDLNTRNRLAMALYRMNHFQEAKEEFNLIIKKDPVNFNAFDGLGLVLIKMEKYREAEQCLKKAVSINKQDVMVYVHLSVVYQKMKLRIKARREFKKALSLSLDPIQRDDVYRELRLLSGP